MHFLSLSVLIATLASIVIVIISILKRNSAESRFFPLLAVCIFLYIFGYYMEINATTVETAFQATVIEYLGMPYLPTLCVFFLTDYYSIPIRLPLRIAVLMPSLAATVLMVTSPWHDLYYRDVDFYPGPPIAQIRFTPTMVYYIIMVYLALLLVFCLLLVAYNIAVLPVKARPREYLLFIAILLPLASLTLYTLNLTPYHFDFTPHVMVVSLMNLFYTIFRMNLFRLLPLSQAKILEDMNDAFIVLDQEKHYLDANYAAKKLFPSLETALYGDNISDINELPNFLSYAESGQEFLLQREDSFRYYRVSCSAINGKKGFAQCTCIILYDVTETKQLVEKLHQMATYDNLTQIFNRGSFMQMAALEFDKANANASSLSVMMIDLDFFKRINDTYGHPGGDMVLSTVAKKLKSRLRQGDLFGRYGGEEFCVCLSDISIENACTLAESLRQLIEEEPFQYGDSPPFSVTISIGLSPYTRSYHNNLDALLSDADNALYQAKAEGRNRVVVHYRPPGYTSCRTQCITTQ